jgi:hypothetical protein
MNREASSLNRNEVVTRGNCGPCFNLFVNIPPRNIQNEVVTFSGLNLAVVIQRRRCGVYILLYDSVISYLIL